MLFCVPEVERGSGFTYDYALSSLPAAPLALAQIWERGPATVIDKLSWRVLSAGAERQGGDISKATSTHQPSVGHTRCVATRPRYLSVEHAHCLVPHIGLGSPLAWVRDPESCQVCVWSRALLETSPSVHGPPHGKLGGAGLPAASPGCCED